MDRTVHDFQNHETALRVVGFIDAVIPRIRENIKLSFSDTIIRMMFDRILYRGAVNCGGHDEKKNEEQRIE